MIQRQHLNFYRRRLEDNVSLLEYSLRQVDPGAKLGRAEDDKRKRARIALKSIEGSGKRFTWTKGWQYWPPQKQNYHSIL